MSRGRHAWALSMIAGAMLTGCALPPDQDEARICRTALPALEGDGAVIRLTRVGRGAEPHSVSLGYTLGEAGPAREALCVFAATRFAGQPDLVGIRGDAGAIAGARLYLLKRYYLDTPEALAAAPDAGSADLAVPELSPRLAYAAQTALLAAPHAAIYALLAASYALVYGLVGRINLAFGEIAAVAATALGLTVAGLGIAFDAPPLLALPAGIAAALFAGAIHAAISGHFTFVRLRGASAQTSLVATIGAALALMEYLRLAQGTRAHWLPPLSAEAVPVARAGAFLVAAAPAGLASAAIGFIAVGLLVLALRRSPFGRAWRAYADDPLAASLFGVDGAALTRATLALAGAGAGLASALVAIQFGGLNFADGFALGLKALLAAILGGIGSVPAAAIGGICIGLFESVWSAYWPIEARDGALLALLVAALVLRPNGLFGTPAPPGRHIDRGPL